MLIRVIYKLGISHPQNDKFTTVTRIDLNLSVLMCSTVHCDMFVCNQCLHTSFKDQNTKYSFSKYVVYTYYNNNYILFLFYYTCFFETILQEEIDKVCVSIKLDIK